VEATAPAGAGASTGADQGVRCDAGSAASSATGRASSSGLRGRPSTEVSGRAGLASGDCAGTRGAVVGLRWDSACAAPSLSTAANSAFGLGAGAGSDLAGLLAVFGSTRIVPPIAQVRL